MGSLPKKEKWFIAYKRNEGDIFDLGEFIEIPCPKERYYADPFLLDNYLFFEDYDYTKGVISCINLEDQEKKATVVLERDYHLSYPFVFRDGDEIYMVPETGANHKIELYRATSFPYEWEFVKVLVDGITAGDTNIYKDKKKYYLITTNGNDNRLFILQSDSLLGNWELYTERMIENSRGAGNMFMHDDMLMRPVQDCTDHYGQGIIIKRVNLKPDQYFETNFKRIEPLWAEFLEGCHTFNFNEEYIVIDGKRKAYG